MHNRTIGTLTTTLGLVAASAAVAQPTIDASNFGVAAVALYQDLASNQFGSIQSAEAQATQNFNGFRTANFAQDGFAGTSQATNVSHYAPGTPGLGNAFTHIYADMHAEASITQSVVAGHNREAAHGSAFIEVYFTLGADTDWTFDADLAGTSTPGFGNWGGGRVPHL